VNVIIVIVLTHTHTHTHKPLMSLHDPINMANRNSVYYNPLEYPDRLVAQIPPISINSTNKIYKIIVSEIYKQNE
jgi:hypothetical protein